MIHQVDVRNRRMNIIGKGSKERTIPFSPRTGQAMWKYLTIRKEDNIGDYLFTNLLGGSLDRHDLRRTLARIGDRAGV